MLDPELGQLQYFVHEHGKSQKPRGSLPLIGASVVQSDEAPHMFIVNSFNGELYKLRGTLTLISQRLGIQGDSMGTVGRLRCLVGVLRLRNIVIPLQQLKLCTGGKTFPTTQSLFWKSI